MIAVAAILAALAAAAAAEQARRAIEGAVSRYRERYGIDSASDVRDALPHLEAGDVRALGVAAALAGAALGALAGSVPGALVGLVCGAVLPHGVVAWLRARRIRRFDRQLVDALETAASGLQAGLSLLQALEGATAESGAPLRDEFGLALREIRVGAAPEHAFEQLAARVDSEELALFVAGTTMARQVGGNLAGSYRTMAEALRERFRVEGKIRALTAQGRMQGWVVGAMPVLLAFVLHHLRPDLVEPMLRHPFGWAIAAAVLLLEVTGFVWIRRVVTPVY